MPYIDAQMVEDIAIGAAFLGTGGGGDPYVGKLMALQAIEKYGALKGSGLALKRILRCHPWNPGGFDPVP